MAKLIRFLKKSNQRATLKLLLKELNNEQPDIRERAEKTLLEFGESAVAILIDFLNEQDRFIRIGAVRILGKMKASQATTNLIKRLEDEDWFVGARIIEALGDIQDTAALETLIKILHSDGSEGLLMREKAPELIIGKTMLREIPSSDGLKEKAATAIGKIGGPKAVTVLTQALKDKLEEVVKYHVAKVLGDMGDPQAIEPLISALGLVEINDSANLFCLSMIKSLMKFKDKRAIPQLVKKLEFEDSSVQSQAAIALGQIGDEETLELLKEKLIQEKREEVKIAIKRAMAGIDRKLKEARGTVKQIVHTQIEPFDKEKFEKEVKESFNKELKNIIFNTPGIPQKALYEKGYIPYTFWWLAKAGLIKREKLGSSYKLFIPEEASQSTGKNNRRELLHRTWDQRENILREIYPNSSRMIFEYFGKEKLKEIFKSDEIIYREWQQYNKKYGVEQSEKHGWKTCYPEGYSKEDYFFGLKKDNYVSNSFLTQYGAGLGFQANKELTEVIEKYWNEDCSKRLKEFCLKYGFLAVNYFIDNELKSILGEEQLLDFYAELEEKASMFKIKICGSPPFFAKSAHIPIMYANHLKFKWGLQPEVCKKKCIYCGENFYPFSSHNTNFSQIISFYPIVKNIKEVNFCPKHFPPSSFGTFFEDEMRKKQDIIPRMNGLLKKLADVLEFFPPQTFHSELHYLKDISEEKFEKAIMIINKMPSFKKELSYHPNGYKEIFGSWIAALDAAGILEGGVIKTKRGYRCAAKDGHSCGSLGEKIVDDFLYAHNIPHEKEPSYPGERRFRADWKIDDTFIELWGLQGDEDYDKKTAQKRQLAKEHNITLIELTFADLRKLDEKLKFLQK